jgi:hypothetical protein
MVQTMADFARNETGKGKADLADYLRNVGVIPGRESMTEIAARMTSGDAKALVQALAMEAKKSKDRVDVIMTLIQCSNAVQKMLQSAQNKPARVAAAG